MFRHRIMESYCYGAICLLIVQKNAANDNFIRLKIDFILFLWESYIGMQKY